MVGIMRRRTLLVSIALTVSGAAYAQAVSVPQQGTDVGPRVMGAIADKIVSQNSGDHVTVVGVPTRCQPREAALCDGKAFSRDGLNEAAKGAQHLAAALQVAVSADPVNDARQHVAQPVIDSSKSKRLWYSHCAPGPYVLTIKPSAIRETKAGSEWHVVVTVNHDPQRGECVGAATVSDYRCGSRF